MYKVMLVDDENLILQGLLNIINWAELGLEVLHLADNGREALEKFQEVPVDIIITDINMPIITGLEIIKKVKEIKKDVKFIILSGYDDFSYARTAIKYGVENYILKPINEEELKASLIDIVNKFKERKQKDSKLLDKNRILMKLINGKIPITELSNIKEVLNIELENKSYTVSNILFKNKETDNSEVIYSNIKENTVDAFEIIYNINGDMILINSWNRDINKQEIIAYLKKLQSTLSLELRQDIFIAIGDVVDSIEIIKESYDISNNIKKYILTKGYNACLSKDDIPDFETGSNGFLSEIDELNKLIIERDKIKINTYISSIFEENNLTPQNIYDLSIKILILIDKIAEEFNFRKNYRKDSLSNIIIELCNESSRENIKKFIENEIIELLKVMSLDSTQYTPIIQQVIKYTEDRYYEELSLKTLSQKYNINSSYLGQIFSKEVGCSFSEYLNKIKNIKAKELILNTNMKINDIARQVGYIDTSYFYRKFKKHYGVSPAALREIKNY